MSLPTISSYDQHASFNNNDSKTMCVQIGDLTVWFSYDTPVAFQSGGNARVVHENSWSKTTGKHLNWIDGGDKEGRVNEETFELEWQKVSQEVVP